MAQFIEQNRISTESKWEVKGRYGNSIGEVKFNNTEFAYYPNQKAIETGISNETLQEIIDFTNRKNDLL